ncbi:hypothetical protein BT63DRAFT_33050 [Microthyrium microscopicum]|uniref:Uncharacterized protein n=1 Tax=Microthyrium microscopicum TaxID=703497 RepID=A0A6A6UU16_9PEZI|nr:hypothetical protein BT63DRAFT_33050 [Microthyrium microscopicum]
MGSQGGAAMSNAIKAYFRKADSKPLTMAYKLPGERRSRDRHTEGWVIGKIYQSYEGFNGLDQEAFDILKENMNLSCGIWRAAVNMTMGSTADSPLPLMPETTTPTYLEDIHAEIRQLDLALDAFTLLWLANDPLPTISKHLGQMLQDFCPNDKDKKFIRGVQRRVQETIDTCGSVYDTLKFIAAVRWHVYLMKNWDPILAYFRAVDKEVPNWSILERVIQFLEGRRVALMEYHTAKVEQAKTKTSKQLNAVNLGQLEVKTNAISVQKRDNGPDDFDSLYDVSDDGKAARAARTVGEAHISEANDDSNGRATSSKHIEFVRREVFVEISDVLNVWSGLPPSRSGPSTSQRHTQPNSVSQKLWNLRAKTYNKKN